jgi:hypothetical protein
MVVVSAVVVVVAASFAHLDAVVFVFADVVVITH